MSELLIGFVIMLLTNGLGGFKSQTPETITKNETEEVIQPLLAEENPINNYQTQPISEEISRLKEENETLKEKNKKISESLLKNEYYPIISADMMNVFYAGFNNIVSISVPGIPLANINASMTGGELRRSETGWIAKPSKVGQQCIISVSVTINGTTRSAGSKAFRVKALPTPAAYLEYEDLNGKKALYKGRTSISKKFLIESPKVTARLEDADMDIRYRVISFEMTTTDNTATHTN